MFEILRSYRLVAWLPCSPTYTKILTRHRRLHPLVMEREESDLIDGKLQTKRANSSLRDEGEKTSSVEAILQYEQHLVASQ